MPYTQKNHARRRADAGAGGGSGGAAAGAASVAERADAGATTNDLGQAPIDRIYTVRHQKCVRFRKRLRSHKCGASCARIIRRERTGMR